MKPPLETGKKCWKGKKSSSNQSKQDFAGKTRIAMFVQAVLFSGWYETIGFSKI